MRARYGSVTGPVSGAFADSLVSMARIMGSFPAAFFLDSASVAPRGSGPPVLLVHGLYHNASAWLAFRRELRRQGLTNVHLLGYNSLTEAFDQVLEKYKARLAAMHEAHGGARVALVGHSLGGLLTRALLADGRAAPMVSCAATLGAPFGGSMLGRVGIGGLARGLADNSELMARIKGLPLPGGAPFLSIYNDTDNMVVPASGLRVDEPGVMEKLAPPGAHVGMIYDRDLAISVARWIADHNKGDNKDG